MDLEQLRLAGLLPQRESLQQILLDESFPPDLHPHEIAHAKVGAFKRGGDDKSWDSYFHASGQAHHHGHAADEISKMIKSGELGGDKGHHENAHHAHKHAMLLHHHAGEMAMRAGAPWMQSVHAGHAHDHEKMAGKHENKFKK